jgi:hypothetical protein
VLGRKSCFGAARAAGHELVARSLTVVAACRHQERHVWTFLCALRVERNIEAPQ